MTEEKNTGEVVRTFKIRYILAGLAVLLFLLSILSYHKADLAALDGGSTEPILNWVGPAGAWVARVFFYGFGVATYPIVLFLLLCAARSFLPRPTQRKGYILSLLFVIAGLSVLLALFPRHFVTITDRLGIGRAGKPDLALSGGAFGALFAAPETKNFPAGWLRRLIGPIGSGVCASVFILSGLFFVFLADWKIFCVRSGKKNGLKVPVAPRAPEIVPEGETPKKNLLAFLTGKGRDKTIAAPGAAGGEPAAETPTGPDDPPETGKSGAGPDDPYAAIQKPVPVVSRLRNTPADNRRPYELPPISLLDRPKENRGEDLLHLDAAKATLQSTLDSFDIAGTVTDTVVGPRITRFEISLQPGVRVEKVTTIQNNIAKDMRAESIRILAPVPGSDTVGIELPNKVSNMVYLRELMESGAWRNTHAHIPIILGKDVAGKVIIADLSKAPHLLIAGSTGSGKSVCMNTLVMSLLYRFSPFDLKLIMVDPKYVELEIYRPLPHLITPVVNDPAKVQYALRWGVNEMERRYQAMARVKAKNLEAFNNRPPDPEPVPDENGETVPQKLPLLVIIVDELADIMMTEARKDVETSICRIAQKGRAAGIHLVIATQTPRKDIITGVIKANLPTKIAFKVSTSMDSRVILDTQGAEKLLGKGDMLYKGPDGETERIQGSMVSDPEIQKVADFVSSQVEQHFDDTVLLEKEADEEAEKEDEGNSFPEIEFDDGASDYIRTTVAKYLQPGDDQHMKKALEIILRENKVSTSYLQRRMGIGYNKAADLIDRLEKRGIVSAPLAGGQKREILIFDELNRAEK